MSSKNNSRKNKEDCEELVLQAQKGSEDAFNELVVLYKPIIVFKANKFTGLAEIDDLVQDGLMALWGAVQTYCPQKGASFSTYAGKCIDNRILSAVNKANGKKHIPSDLLVYLDSEETPQIKDHITPEQKLIDRESYASFIHKVKSRLSSFEFAVLSYHTAGESYKRIAEILQVDIKAVDNAVQRIRKKLKGCSL